MSSTPCDTLVVAGHTIYPLACLCKYEFVDALLANFAVEAMRVVGVVAGHDGLVEDREPADVAAVRAVCTDRRAIGK